MISDADSQTGQELLAAAGCRAVDRKPRRTPREDAPTGLRFCGICQCVFPDQ